MRSVSAGAARNLPSGPGAPGIPEHSQTSAPGSDCGLGGITGARPADYRLLPSRRWGWRPRVPAPLVSGRCWLPGPCSARGPGAGAGGGPLTIQSQGQTSLVRLPRQGLRCLPCGQRSQEGEGHIPSPLRCCLFCSTSGSTGPASRPEGGAGDPQVRAGSCSPPGDAATLTWGPAPLPREPQCILGCADHEPLVRETRQFSSTGQFETFWNSRGPTVGAGTPSSAWARCPPHAEVVPSAHPSFRGPALSSVAWALRWAGFVLVVCGLPPKGWQCPFCLGAGRARSDSTPACPPGKAQLLSSWCISTASPTVAIGHREPVATRSLDFCLCSGCVLAGVQGRQFCSCWLGLEGLACIPWEPRVCWAFLPFLGTLALAL